MTLVTENLPGTARVRVREEYKKGGGEEDNKIYCGESTMS